MYKIKVTTNLLGGVILFALVQVYDRWLSSNVSLLYLYFHDGAETPGAGGGGAVKFTDVL